MRRRVAHWLVAGVLLGAALASAQMEKRTVRGTVTYRGGEPAAQAAVELENTTTMQVVSQRTDAKGHYHFSGLDSNLEYTVAATKKGYWSKRYTVSKFSSKNEIEVNLTLEPSR